MLKWRFNAPSKEGAFVATVFIQPKGWMNEPWNITITADSRDEVIKKIESECNHFIHSISGEIHHDGVSEAFTLFNKQESTEQFNSCSADSFFIFILK